MKVWTLLYSLTALSCAALAQTPSQREPELAQTIEKFVFGGYSEGFGDKQIMRAGDAAALALIRVVSDRELTRLQIESALDVLNIAFKNLSWIENPTDRQPNATFFVLRYLDLCSQDQDAALRTAIAESRTRIAEQTAKPAKAGLH